MTLSKSKALDAFLESKRRLKFSLKLKSKVPRNFLKFVNEFAANIIELTFIDIKLSSYYEFIANLSKLKNMKTLKISNCSFHRTGSMPSDYLTLSNTELCLSNLEKHGMNDFEISHLLSITPNLIKLSCDVTEYNDSGKPICDYLVNPLLTKSLKELKIFGIKSCLLCNFFQSKHLDLELFFWKSYNTVRSIREIETFLIGQRNLKIVNFYFFPGYFQNICKELDFKEMSKSLIIVNAWKDFYTRRSWF